MDTPRFAVKKPLTVKRGVSTFAYLETLGFAYRALTFKRQGAVPVISVRLCGDGVPDLTRGGGSYACPRSGCPPGWPLQPDRSRREGSLVKSGTALSFFTLNGGPHPSVFPRQPTGVGAAVARALAGAKASAPWRRRERPSGPP